jgi:hypothetical protein
VDVRVHFSRPVIHKGSLQSPINSTIHVRYNSERWTMSTNPSDSECYTPTADFFRNYSRITDYLDIMFISFFKFKNNVRKTILFPPNRLKVY